MPITQFEQNEGATAAPRPSIREVARLAGVSLSTVSSVMTDRKGARIADETRYRVKEAAQRLGYRPNNVARALASGRTYIVGVLVSRSRTTTFEAESILQGASAVAHERGYQVQLSFHQYDTVDSLEPAVRDLMAHKLDGILTIASRSSIDPKIVSLLEATGLPFSMAYQAISQIADGAVVDQKQGGYLATEHLLKRGCARIAFAGGDESVPVALTRLAGFRQALADWKRRVDQHPVLQCGCNAAGGIETVEKLIAMGRPMPDGIAAFDDGVASGILRGLRKHGLAAPRDVRVVGFNDFTPICEACDPPLTSIRMPTEETGRLAAKLLVDRLETDQKAAPRTVALPCALVERESA